MWSVRAFFLLALTTNLACESRPEAPPERIGRPIYVARSGPLTRSETAAVEDKRAHVRREEAEGSGAAPDPLQAWTLALRAEESGQRGELSKAATTYARAVEEDPDTPWLRVSWAWYLSRTEKVADARDELDRALENAPPHDTVLRATIHYALGELQEARQDEVRARDSYRTAIQFWSTPPLARALLRLTPRDSDQREAAERLAFGEGVPPAFLGEHFPARDQPNDAEALTAAALPQGHRGVVVAHRTPEAALLPVGARYELLVFPPAGTPETVVPWSPTRRLPLGTSAVQRWGKAAIKTASLGPHREGLWVTVVHTLPGPAAPTETWTSLILPLAAPGREILVQRKTGEETEIRFGCRQSWSENLTLEDQDGDGVSDRDPARPTGSGSASLRPAD